MTFGFGEIRFVINIHFVFEIGIVFSRDVKRENLISGEDFSREMQGVVEIAAIIVPKIDDDGLSVACVSEKAGNA